MVCRAIFRPLRRQIAYFTSNIEKGVSLKKTDRTQLLRSGRVLSLYYYLTKKLFTAMIEQHSLLLPQRIVGGYEPFFIDTRVACLGAADLVDTFFAVFFGAAVLGLSALSA